MSEEKIRAAVAGMGSILTDEGVAFRVWAPHAQSVAVMGNFNGWSDDANPMTSEENGYWYTEIKGAKVGDEYKYRIINNEKILDKQDPYARHVTSSVGNSVVYDPDRFDWQGDDFKMAPMNELVIYEMHIGSFVSEKPDEPGNFAEVIANLNHLKRLGVNAVQVMPIAEFAGSYSWGYNPANIFSVENTYGGPDGFKRFVREAHKQGIAVIQDVVYNHFGPSDLDLWQFDGWEENGKGGIYFYNDDRSQTPWGDTRPDYGRPEVRKFIRDNAMMWLEEYHVDGLRMDMTLYMRTIDGNPDREIAEGWSMMQYLNEEIQNHFPGTLTIAEDLRSNPWITKSVGEGGAGYLSQWDENFVHPVRELVTEIRDEDRSMDLLRDSIVYSYDGDGFRRVIYSESHDEVANGKARVPQEIDPENPTGWHAQKRSTLAAGLVFTAPGLPMLFQGQEFLQGEWFRDDVPLDWDLNEAFSGIVRLYRDFMRLRLNKKGYTRGLCGQFTNVFHVNDSDNMLAFQRWDQHGKGDDVVVVVNFSSEPKKDYVIGLPDEGIWKLRLNSDAKIYSNDFEGFFSSDTEGFPEGQDGLTHHGAINIGAYSMLIFSQDK